ncbi:unnamed protein product [Boreogadus saida]
MECAICSLTQCASGSCVRLRPLNNKRLKRQNLVFCVGIDLFFITIIIIIRIIIIIDQSDCLLMCQND